MHPRNMNAQSIFGLVCLLAMVTIVAEMTREVNTFNMVPEMYLKQESIKQRRIFEDFWPNSRSKKRERKCTHSTLYSQ